MTALNRFLNFVVLLASLASWLPAHALNDRMTLASATGEVGQVVEIPLNLQDIPGTVVDTIPPFDGFYDVAIMLNFDPSLVTAVEFVASGISVLDPPFLFANLSNSSTGVARMLSSHIDPMAIELGGPETEYCTLRITPSAAAAGRTISFTVVDAETYIGGNSGLITLQQSLGNLTLTVGSLSVGSVSGGAPVISSFSASPASITQGGSSTLSWSVSNADSVSISPGIGSVSASGSRSVSPSATTTYTITASNANGTQTQTTTVTVVAVGQPQITTFSASPTQVSANGSSTLTWAATDATTFSISPGIGSVATSGSRIVTPGQTTTYTATATNASGSVSASATVTVLPAPVIVSFSASSSQVQAGESITLSWNVTNATSVKLDGTTVSAVGNKTVVVNQTTTYRLVATGALNQTSSASQTVQVGGNSGFSFNEEEIDFGAETNSRRLDFFVNTAGIYTWTLENMPAWLTANPMTGTVDGERATEILFTVDRKRLFPGQEVSAVVTATSPGLRSANLTILASRPKLESETYLYYPLLQATESKRSELTVINLDQDSAQMLLQVYLPNGTLMATPVEELIPALGSYRLALNATLVGGQAWAVATLSSASGVAPSAQGSSSTRSADGGELYGLSAQTESSEFLYVPHIAQDTGVFFTQNSVVNLASEERTARISTATPVNIQTQQPAQQSFFDYADLLGDQISSVTWSKVDYDIALQEATIGAEIFGFQAAQRTVGVGLSQASSKTMYFAHIARDLANFWTGIVVINLENRSTLINFQAYNYDGQLINGGFSQTFAAKEKKTFVVLGDRQDFGPDASWVKVTSSGQMIGYELFANPSGSTWDTFAGLEGIPSLSRNLVFCHTEEGVTNNGITAVAIINPGTEPARITFRLYDSNGNKRAETTVPSLGPAQKLTRALSAIFTQTSIGFGDIILVDSDQEIAGFELYGDLSRTMGAILAAPNP